MLWYRYNVSHSAAPSEGIAPTEHLANSKLKRSMDKCCHCWLALQGKCFALTYFTDNDRLMFEVQTVFFTPFWEKGRQCLEKWEMEKTNFLKLPNTSCFAWLLWHSHYIKTHTLYPYLENSIPTAMKLGCSCHGNFNSEFCILCH